MKNKLEFEDFLKAYVDHVIKSITAKEIVLVNKSLDIPVNEEGIIEKVPAGYIAYNQKTGKVLVGGKFLNVKLENLAESGWVLVPVQKDVSLEEAKQLAQKVIKENKKEVSEQEAKILGKFLEDIIEKRGKEGELDLEKEKESVKAGIKKIIAIASQHGLGKLEEVKEVIETDRKLKQAGQPKLKLDDYLVYDKKNRRLATLRTFLEFRDYFSDDVVVFTDDLAKTRPSLSGQPEWHFQKANELYLKTDTEDKTTNKHLETLAKWIRKAGVLAGRSIPPKVLQALEYLTANGQDGLPFSIFDVQNGVILEFDENVVQYFRTPYAGRPEFLEKNQIEELARNLTPSLVGSRLYEIGSGEIATEEVVVDDDEERRFDVFTQENIDSNYEAKTLNAQTHLYLSIGDWARRTFFRSKSQEEVQDKEGFTGIEDVLIRNLEQIRENIAKRFDGIFVRRYNEFRSSRMVNEEIQKIIESLFDKHLPNIREALQGSLKNFLPIRRVKDSSTGQSLHYQDAIDWLLGLKLAGAKILSTLTRKEKNELKKHIEPTARDITENAPVFNPDLYLTNAQLYASFRFLHPFFRHSPLFKHLSPLKKPQQVGHFFGYVTGLGKTVLGLWLYGIYRSTLVPNKDGKLEPLYAFRDKDGKPMFADRPVLIVGPSQILDNWVNDANQIVFDPLWFNNTEWSLSNPDGSYLMIRGNKEEREKKYRQLLIAWARKNAGEDIKLPKMVLIGTSLMSVGSSQGVDLEQQETLTDETYLQLLAGPATYRVGEQTYKTKTGAFGMLIIDEMSKFFSETSTRRQFLERLAKSVTSDKNQGYVFAFNAYAVNNSANDVISVSKMFLHDPNIISDKEFRTQGGLLKEGKIQNFMRTLFDTIYKDNLDIDIRINMEIKEGENTDVVTIPVDMMQRPTEYRARIALPFAKLALAYKTLFERGRNPDDQTFIKEYAPDGEVRNSQVPFQKIYERYVPAFYQLTRDMQSGGFNWRRYLEYGLISLSKDDPSTCFVAKETTKTEDGKVRVERKAVSAEDAILKGLAHSLTHSASVRRAILSLGSNSGIFSKKNENLRKLLLEIDKLSEQMLTAKGENYINLEKQLIERRKQLEQELSKRKDTVLAPLSYTITHGLSSAEVTVPLSTSSEVEDEAVSLFGGTPAGFGTGSRTVKLRLPGWLLHITPDASDEEAGTAFQHEGFETELSQGRRRKQGSERKVYAETRNDMINLSLLLGLLSDENVKYEAYLAEENKQPVIKVRAIDKDGKVSDVTQSLLGQPVTIVNDDNSTFSTTINAIATSLSKGVDRYTDYAILETKTLRQTIEKIKQELGVGKNGASNIANRRGAIFFASRRAFDAFKRAVEDGDPEIPKEIRDAILNGGFLYADQDLSERQAVVKKYQDAKGTNALIVTTIDVGGVGLNLNGDFGIIHGHPSAEKIYQAVGRLFRIASKDVSKNIRISYIIGKILLEVIRLKENIKDITTSRRAMDEGELSSEEKVSYQKALQERQTASPTRLFAGFYESGTNKLTDEAVKFLQQIKKYLSQM